MTERIKLNVQRYKGSLAALRNATKRFPAMEPARFMENLHETVFPHIVKLKDGKKTMTQIVEEGDALLKGIRDSRAQSSAAFSQRIADTQKEARCFMVIGPSGVGKQSINNFLVGKGLLQLLLFNTRPDRGPKELYGIAYHFVRLTLALEKRYKEVIDIVQTEYSGKIAAADPDTARALKDELKGKVKELQGKLCEDRAKLFMEKLMQKYRIISFENVQGQAQAVPHLLFDLARQCTDPVMASPVADPFIEVDISHARRIIEAAKEESEKGSKISVFPIFVCPVDFTSLAWQLVLRTLGENRNGGGETWYDLIFNQNMNVENSVILEEFGEYVGNRLYNGMKNVQEGMALAETAPIPPLFIENNDLRVTEAMLESTCKFRFPVQVNQRSDGDRVRVSPFITVANYQKLLEAQPKSLGLNLPEIKTEFPDDPAFAAYYQGLIMSTRESHRAISLADYMKVYMQSAHLVWGDLAQYQLLRSRRPNEVYDVVIQPGTFSPYSFGNLSSLLAAMKDENLNGAIIMPGAVPPRRVEIGFLHRLEMARLATIEQSKYVKVSPLRYEQTQLLKGITLGVSGRGRTQRLIDLGAFSFLIAMNPHVQFHYLAGSEKANDYGSFGKKEDSLLIDLLLGQKVPLLWQRNPNSEFSLFQKEWEHFMPQINKGEDPKKLSRILEHEEELKNLLTESTTPAVWMPGSELRRNLLDFYPMRDYVHPRVIDYIYRKGITDGFRLIQEYENLVGETAELLKAGTRIGGHVKDQLTVKLSAINAERKRLMEDERKVIDEGELIIFEDLIYDARALAGKGVV